MSSDILKAVWWPVHVAIAWVQTRDLDLVEDVGNAHKALLSVAAALAWHDLKGERIRRHFDNLDDAWSALRDSAAAGNLRLSGQPFLRKADLSGNAVETNDPTREISAAEVSTLRLQDDGDDEIILVPEDWRVAHGSNFNNLRGYRSVRVFQRELLNEFKAGHMPTQWEKSATSGEEAAAIKQLAFQLRTNPDWRREDARQWLSASGFRLSQRGFRDRVWPNARITAGLSKTADPGRKKSSR